MLQVVKQAKIGVLGKTPGKPGRLTPAAEDYLGMRPSRGY